MPSKAVVEKALATIRKRAANYEYFFEQLDSPDWLSPLREAGLFASPPPAVRVGNMVSFPNWPETKYLARIAGRTPDAVLDVLLKLPKSDNMRVHEELAGVALKLRPNLAAKWARKESDWIKDETRLYVFPERYGQLVVHLASGGQGDAALMLARRLFEVQSDAEPNRVVRDLRIKMSDWEYGSLLHRLGPVLVAALGVKGFEFYVSLLDSATRALEPEGGARYSFTWRPAIEDHEQNVGHRPIDDLVACTRDAAENLVLGGFAEPADVAKRLLEQGHVFARIGLHVLWKFPDRSAEVVARCVEDRANFDNLELRHEYEALLEATATQLPTEVVKTAVGWIEEGPEDWVELRQKDGRPTEEIERGIRLWQRDRLYPLRRALPSDWQRRYADLVGEFGEPENPGFVGYRTSFVGPTSPKTVAELRLLDLEELLEFLRSWRPKGDWAVPTEEGLGRILEQVVAAEPERFVENCERFEGLDPTYVRSVLAGIATVARTGKAVAWPPVLRLCAWVIQQERSIAGRSARRKMDRDPDWGWTRKQMADLLVQGLEPRETGIPISGRRDVWQLLEALSKDPDPGRSMNEQSTMDPFSQSLNTVRGQTMHAVMLYALWVHRDGKAEQREVGPEGLQPEVKQLLDAALDPDLEPSVSVRSVFGRWLWMLAAADPHWLSEHLEKIFPDTAARNHLMRASWETYLSLTRPSPKLLRLLARQYSWAISHLDKPAETRAGSIANPQERLAEHLMTLHWWGELEAETTTGLLRDFYAKANLKLREHALSFVGRSLHGAPSEEAVRKPVARAMALFERRLALAVEQPKGYAGELRGFGWWFSANVIDLDWRFTRLAQVLSVSPELDGAFLVMEELTKHVERKPLDVLDGVERLLRCENPWWLVLGSRARFESILAQALGHREERVREQATVIVHQLGAHGHSNFRHLVQKQRA